MKFAYLALAALYGSVWAAPVLDVEGYGEAYFFSEHSNSSHGVARLTIEPSVDFGNGVTLHSHIGFEHPSENGAWAEAELEALSVDAQVSRDTLLSFGKMHMPIGLYNLYHEPIYFLTIEPSRVENLIVPAEWHESAALIIHKIGDLTLTAGAMTPMDASKMQTDSWIHQGKESYLTGGKRPGWLVRADVGNIDTLLYGASIVTVPLIGANTQATLAEAHASGIWSSGWEGNAILSKGWIGNPETVSALSRNPIAKTAEGASLTVGYDVGRFAGLEKRSVVAFAHSEYARPSRPLLPAALGGTTHSAGADWFITRSVVAKIELRHGNQEGDSIGAGIGFVY